MTDVKIPKKLFVTSSGNDKIPLGFLNDYRPDIASGRSKMDTQLKWAYGSLSSDFYATSTGDRSISYRFVKVEYVNGQVIQTLRRTKYGTDSKGNLSYNVILNSEEINVVVTKNPPQVWDNVPLMGFRILKSVNRYSTSNKLWRVADPRGLQFEISTEVFEDIILNADINHGEIMAACVWVTSKRLILAK